MAQDESLCWAAFRVSTWLFSYRMLHIHKSQGTLQSGYFPETNKNNNYYYLKKLQLSN